MRFIVSPILMVLGFLMMRYTVAITNFFGPIDIAEQYLKSFGGTYIWWRLLGLVILLFGLLWITGVVHIGGSSSILSVPTP